MSKKQNRSRGSVSSQRWMAARTWQRRLVFAGATGGWLRTSSRSWGRALMTTNAGYWKTVFTQSRSSFIVRLLTVAVYREGQPAALHGQTSVLGRQTNNR